LDPISIDGASIRGSTNAKVALIEFSDFECPYCGRSERDVVPEIDRLYLATGKALLVWRHFPLSGHEHAEKAAEAAECGRRQGQFWAFHDWAFQHQTTLDVAGLLAGADALGLDQAAFSQCLEKGTTIGIVKADADLGNTLSVNGTPDWLVGTLQADGRVKVTARLSGAKPLADFTGALDRAIAIASSDMK
jgi:protein-disulfide isomerase